MDKNLNNELKVAVGVIKNQWGEILISKRAKDVHQGGLWEFPGGKLEEGEAFEQALKRELFEELAIEIDTSIPLLEIKHQYTDCSVRLGVQMVTAYKGEPRGMEGQPIKWVAIDDLKKYEFPVANKRIVEVLNLPRYYPIVDESMGDEAAMLLHLNQLIVDGYLMVQFRAKTLAEESFKRLARQVIEICKKAGVRLFINTTVEIASELKADGVHLSSTQLSRLKDSKIGMPFAVSCHSQVELEQAKLLGAAFSVLSPVQKTLSHADAKALGWSSFSALVEPLAMPVYALGGVGVSDVDTALARGACGVSGIRGFYK